MKNLTRAAFEAIVGSIPAGVVVVEKDGLIIYANERAIQLSGVNLCGLNISNIFSKILCVSSVNGKACSTKELPVYTALNTGKSAKAEFVLKRPDGSRIFVLLSAVPLLNENEAVAAVGLFADITELKRLEKNLKQSNKLMADVLASIDDYIFSLDRNWNIIYVGKRTANNAGFEPQYLVGKNFWQFGSIFIGTEVEKNFREAMSQRQLRRFEWKSLLTEGYREFTVYPSAKGITIYGKDVTDRKKIEEALAESEERFRSLVESTSDWIWQVARNGIYIYSSPKIKELLGYEPQEVIGKSPFDLMPKDQKEKAKKIFRMHVKHKKPFQNLENWNIHKNGNLLLFERSAVPILDKNGNVVGYRGIDRDITKRKKAEHALLESEQRMKMAQKIAHLGSWEFFVKENYAVWSEELFHIFNLTPQNHGPSMDEYINFVHPDDVKNIISAIEKFNFDAKVGSSASFDYRIILRDGSVRVLHSQRIVEEVDQSGKPSKIIGIEQDITEQKFIEQQLEQYSKHLEQLVEERTSQLRDAERLATIGQVAGMVGHDIRNPLQATVNELYFAKQTLAESSQGDCKQVLMESFSIIQEQVDYISKIVSDLQDYAKTLHPNLVEVDICELVPDALKTLSIPKNIQAVARCEKDIPILKLDPTYMRRILTNLVNNAIQAMPNGGRLTVSTAKKENHAIITVQDTGVGIPDEFKSKLFTPLFTTKSKGQGFGLPVIKRLVEALGGTINVESEAGKGAKFIILLPLK
jgi:PAS domain S-box-containing protein